MGGWMDEATSPLYLASRLACRASCLICVWVGGWAGGFGVEWMEEKNAWVDR